MIALCRHHADAADNNLFTKQQLRDMKQRPFVADRLSVGWPWATENMLVLLGPVTYVGPRPILSLGGRTLVTFERKRLPGAATPTVNVGLDLLDPSGMQIVRMIDNWFEASVAGIKALNVPTRGRSLHLKHSSGLGIDLELEKLNPAAYKELVQNVMGKEAELVANLLHLESSLRDTDGDVPVLRIAGTFFTPDVTLRVTPKSARMTVHSFGNEEVTLGPRLFSGEGRLNLVQEGRELIRFG